MKIEKLTEEQEIKLNEYKEKWLKIGLSTERVSIKVAKEITDYLYKKILHRRPVSNMIMSSPLSVWKYIYKQIWENNWHKFIREVGQQVWHPLKQDVEQQIEIKEQIWLQIGQPIWEWVLQGVWRGVWQQIKEEDKIWKDIVFINEAHPYLQGQFLSGSFAFYDYINEVLGIQYKCQEKWEWFKKTAQVGLIYPLDDICVISDRPIAIRMKNGVLHSENSPAVEYSDGFCVYALNGVRVRKEIVMTPAEKLDPKILLTENNVEVRREIIRKIGMERILQKLDAKEVDEWREYKLYRIENIDIEPVQILRMVCPSKEIIYTLRVPPHISKAKEAIRWVNHGIDAEEFVREA